MQSDPQEITWLRTRDAKHLRNPDGSFSAVFGRSLHYEEAPGRWEETDLTLRPAADGFVMDRSDVVVKVSANAVEATDRVTGRGIRWLTPQTPVVAGRTATFTHDGLIWRYVTTKSGLKLNAQVLQPRGPRTYEFAYEPLGGAADLRADADGNLASDLFIVPQAFALGADGARYGAGAWRTLPGRRVAFEFDDSTLPAGALPYMLDPTTVFGVTASGDDGTVWRAGASYPPAGPVTVNTGAWIPGFGPTRSYCTTCTDGQPWRIGSGLVRFDTSSLPDDALVTGTTLRASVYNKRDTDNRALTADWYTAWPIDAADYSESAQTNALPGVALSAVISTTPSADNNFALTGFETGVSRTGPTGLRLHISGGQPTGDNFVTFAEYDSPIYPEPRLLVTYLAASAPPTFDACTRAATPAPDRWVATAAAEGLALAGHQAEVSLHTGQLLARVQDDSIPGRGFDAAFSRAYNSASAASRMLGPGWRSSLGESLCILQDGSVAHVDEYGREHRFSPGSGGRFSAPPGVYDALVRDADGTYVLTGSRRIQRHFSAAGLLVRLTDANGNVAAIAHDPAGRPQYVCVGVPSCGEASAKLTLAYDALGRLVRLSDPYPRSWTYSYDASGRLATVTDPLGNATAYAYDPAGRLFSIRDAEANEARVGYESSGQVGWVRDARAVAESGPGISFFYSAGSALVRSAQANSLPSTGPGTTYTLGSAGQLLGMTDPLGNASSRAWDASFNLTSETNALAKTTTYAYDVRGNRTSETDPLGNTAGDTFDSNDNRTSSTDARGKTTAYAYDTAGNLTSVTDPLGGTTTFSYDAYGQKIAQVGPRGNVAGADPAKYRTAFAYDAVGNLVSMTDALGRTTTYSYDAAGNLLKKTNPLGLSITNSYDKVGNLLSRKDGAGNKTTYTYDRAGRQIATVSPVGNSLGNAPGDYAASTAYYPNGLVKTQADALGNATRYAYDWNGNRILETDPRENQTVSSFDLANRLTEVRQAAGAITTFSYDAAGRRTASADPKGTTRWDYDDAGRLVAVRGPRLQSDGTLLKTTHSYDAAGNVISVTKPAGNVPGAPAGSYTTTNTYDDAGRLLSVTDAAGNVTRYGYDAAGNRTSATDPSGAVTTWAYDALDREVERRRPGSDWQQRAWADEPAVPGGWSWNVYAAEPGTIWAALTYRPTADEDLDLELLDASNAVLATASGSGSPKILVYPGAGPGTYKLRVTARAGAAPFTVDWSVPAVDLQTSTYDAAGRLTTQTGPEGQTTYWYDGADRVVQVFRPDWATGNVERFEYDAEGSVTRMADSTGPQTFAHDRAGRLAQATDQAGAVTTYGYDATGNDTAVSRPTGGSFASAWDAQSRLQTRSGVGTTSFSYGDLVYATRLTHASGDIDERVFDPAGLITRTEFKPDAASAPQLALAYAYDAQGNLVRVDDVTGTSTTVHTRAHDGLDRVTSETSQLGGQAQNLQYSYNAVGNRTSMIAAVGTASYAYNPAGQLIAMTSPSGETTSYFYERSGRLTREIGYALYRERDFSWSGADRLAKVDCLGCLPTSFTYDAEGKRVTKTYGITDERVTRYQYERGILVSATETRPENILAGCTVNCQAPQLVTSYQYDSRGIPTSMTLPSGQSYAYHFDAQGSVVALSDSAHQIVARYSYDAFGNVLSATGNSALLAANPYRFLGVNGVMFDPETGLYLMGTRYYNPATGQFISQGASNGGDGSAGGYSAASCDPATGGPPCGGPSQPPSCGPKTTGTYLRLPWRCGQAFPDNGNFFGQGSHNGRGGHTGVDQYAIDFGLPKATDVLATADGVVKCAGAARECDLANSSDQWRDCTCYGYRVIIDHLDGRWSLYAHLSSAGGLSPGERVNQGRLLGRSGDTGRSDAAHLHFAMRNGRQSAALPVPLALVAGNDKWMKNKKGPCSQVGRPCVLRTLGDFSPHDHDRMWESDQAR